MSVPLPTPTLRGVRAKLQRADTNIGDLDKIVRPLADRATNSIVREEHGDPDTPRLIYRVIDIPDIDDQCAAIVGDALFDMRSALDHLAAQLALLDGKIITTEYAYFPIHGNPLNKKGNPRQIGIPGVTNPQVIAALEDAQPYKAVNDYGHDLWNIGLWLINELCNADKHRLLLVMVHRIQLHTSELPWWEGENVRGFMLTAKALETNDIVGLWDFKKPDPNFDPHISLAVALDEGPFGGWPRQSDVVDFLRGLRAAITWEINWRFLPFFVGEIPILSTPT
jgi:hypothetical protein